ncbi:MAG: transglycosylase SLT domain-containing protein [Pseudomonadota bacterium]
MVTRKRPKRASQGCSHRWAWIAAFALAIPTGLFGSNQVYRYAPDALKAVFDTSTAPGTRLSPFDDIIQKYAKIHGMDWRLVASMIYAESRFQYDAVSPAGARGLMQIMPAVAKAHGVLAPEHPEQNVTTGIGHFLWGRHKIKGRTLDDRLKLSLAAYNSGLGHLRDAQKLTMAMGKSPRLWQDVSQALVLLEDPAHFKNAQYGYLNGTETVQYVQRVLAKYRLYRSLYPREPHAAIASAQAASAADA